MSTKEEVEKYLVELFAKIRVFDVIFEERQEFFELQKELEITQTECKEYIKRLDYRNYYKGPSADKIHGGEYWEFGMEVKSTVVYIKINKGLPNKNLICISFHKARHSMKLPLKNK